MKILHVVVDSPYIATAIREFEAVAPGLNEFVLIESGPATNFEQSNLVRAVTLRQFRYEVERLDVRGVIFHSLAPHRRALLRHIPNRIKVVWIGWGYDYYNDLLSGLYPKGLVQPKTQALVQQIPKQFWGKVQSLIRPARALYDRYRIKELCRIDVFCSGIDVEYQLIRAANPWFKPESFFWSYLTFEDDLMLTIEVGDEEKVDLLAGNSASPSNNHVELFESIARHIDLTGRQVFVPLSYGDPRYRDLVIGMGEKILGTHFKPLTEFIPPAEYNRLVGSCGFMLMNQLRQQAVGNLCLAARAGSKIFLDPRNPLFSWFTNRGITIGDVNRPDTIPLTAEQRRAGQAVIEFHWSRQQQRERTRSLVGRIVSGE